jgi:hypothetical protein
MKVLLGLLLLSQLLSAADTLSAFGHEWDVVHAGDWKIGVEHGSEILELLSSRGPLPGPRRPIQFAVARTIAFHQLNLELDVRPRGRSLMLVFAYRDPAHFDYAHLSTDTGIQQPVHNGIFHVFGGERVRISSQEGPPAFAASNRWYHAVLSYDGSKGLVQVTIDGHEVPALRGVDLSLSSGKIGLGSFDEVGDFRNVKIEGK